MYDTSVKIPAIISLPGTIASGRIDRALLNHYDWRPTLLDFLGIADPDAHEMPGESFAPLLRGRDMADRDSLIIIDEYGPVRMIRERNWKYVHRYPEGPHELYYLSVDPDEVVNLVDNDCHTGRIEEMRSDIERFFNDFAVPGIDGSELDVQGGGQRGAASSGNAFSPHPHWVDDFGKPRDDDYIPSFDSELEF